MLKVGDGVRVKIPRGGVQEGTVLALYPDGTFLWENRCNYRRRSRLVAVTTAPEASTVLDPYVKEWGDDGDE